MPWRTVAWLVDTRQLDLLPPFNPGQGKGLDELVQEIERHPTVQWSHNYQGGKAMAPPREEKATQVENRTLDPEPDPQESTPQAQPPEAEPASAHLRGGVKTYGQGPRRGGPGGSLEKYLKVKVVLVTKSGDQVQATALVDTGAEVSLIKKGILPDECFTEAKVKLKLIAANNQKMRGGSHEVGLDMQFSARQVRTREKHTLVTPSDLYLAEEIEEDIILSYGWLAERSLEVVPRQHGMYTTLGEERIWIPGESHFPKQRVNARLPTQPMRILPSR
jgi:hypothetical protein